MSYANGVIANLSSGMAWVAAIDAVLTAEPGISKVESLRVSGTLTWNVYKSAAGNNAQGADFYFAFGYPTTAANAICMTIFEGYNNGTHLATNFPPNVASNTPVANYANPGAATALPSTGAIAYVQSSNIPGNFSWSLNCTANRVHLGYYSPSPLQNEGFSLGLYDPVMSSADDPFPLYCVNLTKQIVNGVQLGSTPTAQTGFSTREPKTLSAASTNFSMGPGIASSPWTYTGGLTSTDTYQGWYYVSRCPIFGRQAGFRGLYKDVYLSAPQSNNGDQLQWTLNSVNYVGTRFCGGGFYMLNT